MNKQNLKKFIKMVIRPVTESLDLDLDIPRSITLYDKDMSEVSEIEHNKLIQSNIDAYFEKTLTDKKQIAIWWNNVWDEKCENIGGALSEKDMVQHISNEGYVIV